MIYLQTSSLAEAAPGGATSGGDKRGSKERASLESLKTAVDRAGLGRTAAEL